MKIFALVVPLLFILTFLFAALKKVKIYDTFCDGVKGAIPLIVSVFPYIAAVMMLSKLFEISGLDEKTAAFLAPVFRLFGIPEELSKLVFIKPLSGSGSTAVLAEILRVHGVDSYIGKCACVIAGSSETVFYIGAVYFAGVKEKRLTAALLISLISFFLSVSLSCFLCRVM